MGFTDPINYRGHDIIVMRHVSSGYSVYWYRWFSTDWIDEKHGFLNGDDAAGYAKDQIDERLRRSKHVSSRSSR